MNDLKADLIEGAYCYTENGIEKVHYCEVNGVKELVTPKEEVIALVPPYEWVHLLESENESFRKIIKEYISLLQSLVDLYSVRIRYDKDEIAKRIKTLQGVLNGKN